MIHHVAGACSARSAQVRYFSVVETEEIEGPSMPYRDSIFGGLLKPIDRRQFASIVDRHNGDAYDKKFDSWSHLVSLICAQLSGAQSLRELEATWQAQAHHHYHLGVVGELRRSTLADANKRRPVAIFAELAQCLIEQASGKMRREGRQMVRLLDSTPIPLGTLMPWATWNGRTRGLKLHVAYDPKRDVPHHLSITPATVNDVTFGRQVPVEANATYVFDKAFCHYGWWAAIHRARAFFVTRRKTNARLRTLARLPLPEAKGDGFAVLKDAIVKRTSRGKAKLDIPLRLIRFKRDNGQILELLTNDRRRSALKIAELYKQRWQIELLFRWIKQHLNIRRFLGRSDNAVRLQIYAAMIAFLLLRIAARLSCIVLQPIRLAQLVATCLFVRKPLARIDKPPEVHPRKAITDPNQLNFTYA
jgi:putative transposase